MTRTALFQAKYMTFWNIVNLADITMIRTILEDNKNLTIFIFVFYVSLVTASGVCPGSKWLWIKRGKELNCSDKNTYHCILSENYTIVEMCLRRRAMDTGTCPLLYSDQNIKQGELACPASVHGCPNHRHGYFSDELYHYPKCWQKRSPGARKSLQGRINEISNNGSGSSSNTGELKGHQKGNNRTENITRYLFHMDRKYIQIPLPYVLVGGGCLIGLLALCLVIVAVIACCKSRCRPRRNVVDRDALLNTPLSSRHHVEYDDIHGFHPYHSASTPIIRPVLSRELLYDYASDNRSLPILDRSFPSINDMPRTPLMSRNHLAVNNQFVSREPVYIDIIDSVSMSAGSYLSPYPQRRYATVDRVQRFRDMIPMRGYNELHTRQATFTARQRRSSL